MRFEQPICLTGIKVGAAPGTGPGAAVTPHIHLFAYDLSTLGAARFAVLTENCTLPTSGTKAVRIEVRTRTSSWQQCPSQALFLLATLQACKSMSISALQLRMPSSLQAVVTNTVILRGHYQTLPVALYGWTIATDDEQQTAPAIGELAFSFKWQAPEPTTQAFAGQDGTLVLWLTLFKLQSNRWPWHSASLGCWRIHAKYRQRKEM